MTTNFQQSDANVSEKGTARFQGEILAKIYKVWLFRKLLPVLLAEIFILSSVLYLLGRTVFIQRVIENALNVMFISPPKLFSFIVVAFAQAPVLTKILALGAAVSLALVIRHLTQGFLRLILIKKNFFGRVNALTAAPK